MLNPQTKLLLAEYGSANFDFGELPSDCSPVEGTEAGNRVVAAKEALVSDLEANYIPKP